MDISWQLDNPVWHSLSETHRQAAIEYDDCKFYRPGYCPFGAFENSVHSVIGISSYANLVDNFYVVGYKPLLPQGIMLSKELVCEQMILPAVPAIKIEEVIVKLNVDHATELYELVNLVQPGYFGMKTWMLGNYYGIFKEGQLVAATGERMKMNGFTEISAVVTHPRYTGKGYAKQLVCHAAKQIFEELKIPFLHVAETNTAAIALYRKLGFETRRKISFWHLAVETKNNSA